MCKLCGEKQSVKRHYGIGTAKDCRLHVQKLNNMRGDKEETIKTYTSEGSDYDENIADNTENINRIGSIDKQSKWSAYVDEPENKDANEPEFLGNLEVVLEVPQKRKTSSTYNKRIKNAKKITASVNCDNFEGIEDEISSTVKLNKTSLLENISIGTLDNKTLNTIENLNSQEKRPCSLSSSKWHQYLEEDDTDKTPGELIENCSVKDSFFSLSDDNDIDKILDLC